MSTVKTKLLIQTSKLKVNSTYNKLVPFMSSEDEKTFDESVKLNGIREPIVINDKNIILDGHSRYRKAVKYKIESIPYTLKKFQNKFLEKKYVIECNLQRRHLITAQKIALALPLIEVESKIARERQKEQGSKYGRGKKKTLASSEAKDKELPLASFDTNDKKGKTVEIISKKINVPASTIERGKKVLEDAPKELKDKVLSGKTSINSAYSQIRIKTRNENMPKVSLPKDQYNVLEIDFPWGYINENVGSDGGGSANQQYPTMPPKEILEKEVPKFKKIIAKDAVIFMWVTTPLLSEIIRLGILEELGFKYKTMITWHKIISKRFFGGKALGFWYNVETEHCVLGVKGKIDPFRSNLPNFIETEMLPHSQKPIQFKELFEESTKFIPGRKMFEGYARRPRKGWVGFGNQLEA